MSFKYATIGSISFGEKLLKKEEKQVESKAKHSLSYLKSDVLFNFRDSKMSKLLEYGQQEANDDYYYYSQLMQSDYEMKVDWGLEAVMVKEFWQCIACCHECIVQKKGNGEIYYSGLSPDEITLVDAARNIGIEFMGVSDGNWITLNVFGK